MLLSDFRFVRWPGLNVEAMAAGVVGPKAANLERVRRIGLDVPEWFVLDSRALVAHMSHVTGSGNDVIPTQREPGQSTLSTQVRDRPLPAAAEGELREAYARLRGDRSAFLVAVRSSGLREDGHGGSAAGIYETVLDVADADGVIAAVKECWASLWSPRSLAYGPAAKGGGLDMAVIVQRMICPRLSGVMFTTSPDVEDGLAIRIAAVSGQGSAVVDGSSNVPEWTIDYGSGRPLSTRRQTVSELSNTELVGLAAAGRSLDAEFRAPQDVEWAIDGDALFILQSRPITASLPPVRPPQWRTGDRALWTRAGLGEWLQRPLTPLFETFCMDAFEGALERLLASRLGFSRRKPTWCALNGYFYARVRPTSLLGAMRSVARSIRRPVAHLDEWRGQLPSYRERLAEHSSMAARCDEPVARLLPRLREVRDTAADMWAWIVLTGTIARVCEYVVRAAYRIVKRRRDPAYAALVRGYVSESVRADQLLWELATELRIGFPESKPRAVTLDDVAATSRDGFDGASWSQRLRGWYGTYGHRALDLDIASPPMTTEAILSLLLNQAAQPPSEPPVDRVRRQESERRRVVELLDRRRGPLMRMWVRRLLPTAQRYAEQRENRPFELHRAWPLMRALAVAVGDALVSAGTLTASDQVFFLTWTEVSAAVHGINRPERAATFTDYALIANRRRLLHEYRQTQAAPQLSAPWGRLLFTSSRRRTTARLRGKAGSPGVVEGPARIIRGLSDFGALRDGEILVCELTTPAWTPLLSRAGAVVTERGSTLAHAAIIAREYGIPAVLGVRRATQVLTSGDIIRVDGNRGFVVTKHPRRG